MRRVTARVTCGFRWVVARRRSSPEPSSIAAVNSQLVGEVVGGYTGKIWEGGDGVGAVLYHFNTLKRDAIGALTIR
jgi:hypothetical protein